MNVQSPASPSGLQLWGGVECTCNRVGERYFDQVARTGHAQRPGDLSVLADFGISTLRYPALWEWAEPLLDGNYSWHWSDERLPWLEQLHINPIIGLLHHGSGPRQTNLLDTALAEGLARYAGAFAQRYPAFRDYTPVNEPLTTARFSALYGHWYPHRRDSYDFAWAMLNQCRAIVLSMRAIRQVRSDARLIQTEEIGPTFGSPSIQTQIDFDNNRRWLTFDLLGGRVVPGHPIGDYFRWLGISEQELYWFAENPCPPDILGVNYYVTSERYLDDRLELYPENLWGGNGRDRYVDGEAVRVRPEGMAGISSLLQETWQRYQLPLAVTEAHLGCTREEQARWFVDIWQQTQDALHHGVDVRAVTAWSLLGAYDWNSLVTKDAGHYEPGAFDVSNGVPRPTAVAYVIRDIAKQGHSSFPPLSQPGWWKSSRRLLGSGTLTSALDLAGKPLLLSEGNSFFAQIFLAQCAIRALPCRIAWPRDAEDAPADYLQQSILENQPWAVIDTAAFERLLSNKIPSMGNAARAYLDVICNDNDLLITSFCLASDVDQVLPLAKAEVSFLNGHCLLLWEVPTIFLLRVREHVVANATKSLVCNQPACRESIDSITSFANAILDLVQDQTMRQWHSSDRDNGQSIAEFDNVRVISPENIDLQETVI
jgi:dTDP-4-dehydrorhamnose reductase